MRSLSTSILLCVVVTTPAAWAAGASGVRAAGGVSPEAVAGAGSALELRVEPGQVVINEFAASNTLIADPAGEMEDWIELRNNTDAAVDLAGFCLSDDAALPAKWLFPAGSLIEAGGYLIVWADEDLEQAGLHAGFKLSASGESLWFSDAGVALLDSVLFGAQSANLSLARVPDGTGPFVQGPPTFGASNGGVAGGLGYHEVVINEFSADNDTLADPAGETEDWIELFNPGDHELELGGLYLSDNPAQPAKWQLPEGTLLAARSFLLIWADEDLDQAGLHADFKLSAGGEAIWFSNPNLSVVDSTHFGAQATNLSRARIPDATGDFQLVPAPTPGRWNVPPPLDPIQLRISHLSSGMVRLAWDLVPGATQVDVYRESRPWQEPAGAAWLSLPAPLDHVDVQAEANASGWYFRVVARNDLGLSTAVAGQPVAGQARLGGD